MQNLGLIGQILVHFKRPMLTYAPLGGDKSLLEAEGTINFLNANQTYLYSKQPFYLKRPSRFFMPPSRWNYIYVTGVVPIGNPCHWHIYILTYQKINHPCRQIFLATINPIGHWWFITITSKPKYLISSTGYLQVNIIIYIYLYKKTRLWFITP